MGCTQKWGLATSAVTVLMLLSLVSVGPACASPCEDSVDIEADNTESRDGIVHYQGNVQMKSGSLIVRGAELAVSEDQTPAMVFHLREATFSFNDGKETIHGFADKVVFYAKECTLDLIGYARVVIDDDVQEYDTVRYFLNKKEIGPLWLHIDQGIRIAPEKNPR